MLPNKSRPTIVTACSLKLKVPSWGCFNATGTKNLSSVSVRPFWRSFTVRRPLSWRYWVRASAPWTQRYPSFPSLATPICSKRSTRRTLAVGTRGSSLILQFSVVVCVWASGYFPYVWVPGDQTGGGWEIGLDDVAVSPEGSGDNLTGDLSMARLLEVVAVIAKFWPFFVS